MKLPKLLLLSSLLFSLFASGATLAFNCKDPSSKDLNECAQRELDRETKKINKLYNEYKVKLSSAQKQQFKEVQLAWIKFKDLSCEFESSRSEGGTIHSMVLSLCLASMTQIRKEEIERLNNCQDDPITYCPI